FLATLILIVAVPGVLAFVFGYFAFRSRIKGVHFSIITQAMTYAAMLFFFRNETGFGGNNGFTDFKRILDHPIATPTMRMLLFVVTGCTLIAFFLLARAIIASKFGRVLQAIRDAESRVMFTGYDPLRYKLAIWTLSAVMCGIAGALYVPQVGIINPSEMTPAASIEIALWTAVGGRPASWSRVATGGLDVAHGAILYLDDITVSFDGFKALNALTLSISAGELRCIIGPNGAGKTTMMDVITGKTRPEAGRAFFGSTIDLLRMRENDIASIGVGRKFQKPTV